MSVNMASEDVMRSETVRDQRAKHAGHVLYGNRPQSTHYSSVGPIREPYDPQKGKMSTVRRTFCLFTTFDLILTFILWVIYTQLIGENPIWKAFQDQVYSYTFEKSLFDTVMVSAVRFTFILLAYALFRISHWWTIALTTTITCIYLLVKCFLFNFSDQVFGGKNPLSYVLLIVCFVLAWVETWLLDFKVIPHETKLRERGLAHTTERTPLLHDSESGNLYQSEESRQFYTPPGSDDEDDRSKKDNFRSLPASRGHSRKASASSVNSFEYDYIKLADEAWDATWQLYHVKDGWKCETGKNQQDGIVYSIYMKQYGRKLFKLEGIVEMAPKDLWEECINGFRECPKWNSTIVEARVLQVINDTTDIAYNIAAEAAGGLVSSRDFVNVRHWGCREGIYMSAGCGCTHPDMPPQKKYVRGDNGPGGWMFKSVENEPNKCLFIWIVNSSLKGWIPQAAIDQAMSSVLVEYLRVLRLHVEDVKAAHRENL